MVCMRNKAGGLVAIREIGEHFPSARRYIEDTPSYRLSGALLWVGSSWNWSVFMERP